MRRSALIWIRYVVEYVLARGFLIVVRILPAGAALRLARSVASAWFLVDARRRRLAIENILRSEITADPATARRIARESFRHFATVIMESLKSEQVLEGDDWRSHVSIDAPPETLALLSTPGRAAILVSGHLGSWELAGRILAGMKPVVGITRKMNNPLTNRLMQRLKTYADLRLTPKHDADFGRFIAVLKGGETLAILIDQYGGHKRGIRIEFLGRPAWTHTGVALLHLVTHVPICFGYCVRTGPASFRLVADAPVVHTPTGNKEQDIRILLETLTHRLETAIRLYPEQYLWAHRRWRMPPAAETPAR